MTTLAQYDAARAALAEATRIDQVLPLREQMEHIKLHAKHVQDRELMADATEIQIRAEAKLGFLLGEAKKSGWLKASRPKKPDPKKPADTEGFTLKEIGVTEKLSAGAQKKASISERALNEMIQGVRDRIISGKARMIDAEVINGSRALMGSRIEPDDSLDYFPTPPWATRALMQHVMPALGIPGRRFDSAWEPACGEGHIAEVLAEYSDVMIASDIFDYGYGQVFDFLEAATVMPAVDWIVTNPPFGKKTEAFTLKALELANVGVAMFVRMQWLETRGRYERIFNDTPPTVIAFFAERVPLCKGEWKPEGDTATAYVWLVWIKGNDPQAPFWIPPDCRTDLEKPDDTTRFVSHPVMTERREVHFSGSDLIDVKTGEVIAEAAPENPTSANLARVADTPNRENALTPAQPETLPESFNCLDVETVADDTFDIPDFLLRKPVVSPRVPTHLVDAGEKG